MFQRPQLHILGREGETRRRRWELNVWLAPCFGLSANLEYHRAESNLSFVGPFLLVSFWWKPKQ